MGLFTWILFMIMAFLSFLLMTKLKLFNIDKKYEYFKYVTIILFIWTIHTWLRMVITDSVMQYYLSLNLYPIVFIMVGILLLAIMKFTDKKIPLVSSEQIHRQKP